ncbi:DUF6893 family small protein [Amycolatopsis sp. NPDC101161]
MKRLLFLAVLLGGVTWLAKQVEPDIRRYLEMSRM